MHLITWLLPQHNPVVEHIHAAETCPPACCGVSKGLCLSYSALPRESEHGIQTETRNDHLFCFDALHALAGIMGIQRRLMRGERYRRSSPIELVTVQKSTNKGLAAPGLPEQGARKVSSSSQPWLVALLSTDHNSSLYTVTPARPIPRKIAPRSFSLKSHCSRLMRSSTPGSSGCSCTFSPLCAAVCCCCCRSHRRI